MGHGPVKLLKTILPNLFPGDVIYPLNSADPLVVVFIVDGAVITNTAELFTSYRVVRERGEWMFEFPFNWEGYVESKDFEIEMSPFDPEDFESRLVIVLLSEERDVAQIHVLDKIDKKGRKYTTINGVSIPFSAGERIIPTGLKYVGDL